MRWLPLLLLGCAPVLPDGRVHSTSYGTAAANVIVGGALYVAAGGCKIAGCPTNTRCNVVTERCDPIQCDKTSCTPDSVCDEKTGQCIPVALKTVNATSSASTTTPAVPAPLGGPNN